MAESSEIPPQPAAHTRPRTLWRLSKGTLEAFATCRLHERGQQLQVAVEGHLVLTMVIHDDDATTVDAEAERARATLMQAGWQP